MDYPILKGKDCEVSVIETSKSQETGVTLTTFSLRYWRAIHSELMTHRVFSRNASSSRAIPTPKLLEQVRTKPAGPIHWGLNQPGMQANEECTALISDPHTGELLTREEAWTRAAVDASNWAEAFSNSGYHKQIVNRLIEPASYITVVLTSTDWDNWNSLRCHEDAQPEIRDLAETMRTLLASPSVRTRQLTAGSFKDARSWHLPFVTMEERRTHRVSDLLAMSAARCARVSYLTHDKQNPTLESDMALYKRLVESKPLHASPLEHQAHNSGQKLPSKNLRGGWVQHRTLLESAGNLETFTFGMNAPKPPTSRQATWNR